MGVGYSFDLGMEVTCIEEDFRVLYKRLKVNLFGRGNQMLISLLCGQQACLHRCWQTPTRQLNSTQLKRARPQLVLMHICLSASLSSVVFACPCAPWIRLLPVASPGHVNERLQMLRALDARAVHVDHARRPKRAGSAVRNELLATSDFEQRAICSSSSKCDQLLERILDLLPVF